MPQRATKRDSAPAETLENLSLGYNGYTAPTLTNPRMWAAAANVFSGAFGFIQRCRFANVVNFSPATGLAFTSLKYFALPTLSAYLLADLNGKLYSYDTGASYAQTQRLNPYIDPAGTGSVSLNGPWSREFLQNIVYEMNGTVKMSGRGANAATIESFGLDAPDASAQVTLNAGSSQTITNIQRVSGVVTVNLGGNLTVPGGNGTGMLNVTISAGDTSFAGTFIIQTGNTTSTLTWLQSGLNTGLLTPTGTVNVNITKAIGRSYAWAWENANKPHISAPSPSTQYIQYSAQNGTIQLFEPGTISITNLTSTVNGTGTFFTSAWVGRSIWVSGVVGQNQPPTRILSVQSATQMTLATAWNLGNVAAANFQIFDQSATHIRLYATSDGGATYFRVQRNAFSPIQSGLQASGLQFFDTANAEPPGFPYTTEVSQLNNLPPPIGKYINEYQGVLVVFGVPGADQSFFYSNQTATTIGMQQESYAPLNQVTLPIQNGKMNGMLEFPSSAIIWSDKQDMFRLSGLLTDNLITTTTAAQQGATIARLPYNLGIANPFACDITPLGGIWVTPNAEIWLFTDRYAPRNIGRPVQDILSTIPTASLSLVRVKYFHSTNRNWLVVAVPANGASFNNTLLVLDLDLLASNGSPSYFTFDMATNSPAWWVFQPGPLVTQGSPPVSTIHPRCDFLETVYEVGGQVRLLAGGVDLIQDVDYRGIAFGTEIQVPGAGNTLHAWGNDSAFMMKRPSFFRFNTNRDPSLLATDGWSFQVQGIDDDFYTFAQPLALTLTPGVNDCSTLGGNPNLVTGSPFRHSPSLFKIGGVNFVMGRRIRTQVNFPAGVGLDYQFRSLQIGFGPVPPR